MDLSPATAQPRRGLDQYTTPAWQVDALCDYVPAITGTIWEPCAGDGSIALQLGKRHPECELLTNDLDLTCPTDLHGDATLALWWAETVEALGQPDWIVTNPPFAQAMSILKFAQETATVGVAFLARLSFSEPTRTRGPWLRDHPHDQRIVLERWSYTGDGKADACTTEWLIFVKDWRILTPPFGISAYGYRPRF